MPHDKRGFYGFFFIAFPIGSHDLPAANYVLTEDDLIIETEDGQPVEEEG